MEEQRISSRLIQARMLGLPSIFAYYQDIMAPTSESLMPRLLIATNDVLDNAHRAHLTSFITGHARPLVAHALAKHWAAANGVRDEDMIMATAYGEMMGVSMAKRKNTVQDRDNARTRIINILKQAPPTINELESLIHAVITICRQSNEQMATEEECRGIIPNNQLVSYQTLRFYTYRCQILPIALFTDKECQVAWATLGDLDTAWVELKNLEFDVIKNYRREWSRFTEDTVLGYYEGKALQNIDRVRGMFGGAIFTYLTSLTRKSNVTPAWVQRRRIQFQTRLPGINFEHYTSDTIIKQFARLYHQVDATWEDVYKQLVRTWNILQVPGGMSLPWNVEQASNNNVTCLTTIADVVSKMQFFDVDVLVSKGMPAENFRQAMIQARDLLHNPFCSLIKPTVSIRHYPDLAYLCTYLKGELIKDQAFTGFRGQPSSMCSMTAANIRQLGNVLFALSKEKATADATQAQNQRYQDDVGIQEERDIAREQRRLARAAWPRQARDLPQNARVITKYEMFEAIEQAESDRGKAFRTVMKRMYAIQVQIPRTQMPDNALVVPTPKKKLAANVVEALRIWDIEVEAAMTDDVAPGEIGGALNLNEHVMLPRESVNALEHELDPNEGNGNDDDAQA